jgi:hypothetical protein
MFIYNLFNDAAREPGHMTLNYRTVVRKDLEGNGYGVIEETIQEFGWKKLGKEKLKMCNVQ